MDTDQSDSADDPGRRDSQFRLKNNMNSKYLDEVIEKTGMDYDEAVELIKREQKARDLATENVANNYASALRPEGVENADWLDKANVKMPVRPAPVAKERQDLHNMRKDDRQKTKDLLAAGKRVAEGEMTSDSEARRVSEVFKFQGPLGQSTESVVKGLQKGVKKATEGLK